MRTHPALPCILLALATAAAAQEPATTFDDLRGRLEPGQRVVLTESDGGTVEGTVLRLSDLGLDLRLGDGEAERYTESMVAAVRRKDSNVNGALIGAGVMLGLMLPYCAPREFEEKTFCQAVATPMAVVLGAGVGVWVDSRFVPRDLFRRPGRTSREVRILPVVSPSRAALMVGVAF